MNPAARPVDTGPHDAEPRLRSGKAASLAGIPVATLRVWERRYGVASEPGTASGQRLYSPRDVQRLRLLRLLTAQGHAIGTIAGLELGALQGLAEQEPARESAARGLVVVGTLAARRLRRMPGVSLLASHDDLETAEAQTARNPVRADTLLVQLSTLQPVSAERVLALRNRLQASVLVVLYGFGAEVVADALRVAGAVVRREPVNARELERLIAGRAAAPVPAQPVSAVAQRRFSDESLVDLVEGPSSLACECPRHVAELVLQLAAFERYSGECLSLSPADAALHRHLAELAGTARTMFERALERVIAEEGAGRGGRTPSTPGPRT